MIVQSSPALNEGKIGTILQITFNSLNDNQAIQQTVVQNGNPSGITYQGIIVDARNALIPFTLRFGPSPSWSFDISPGQYFVRQIPAIPNLTVAIDWGDISGLNSTFVFINSGPQISFVTYKPDSQDFSNIAEPVQQCASVYSGLCGGVTIINGSGVLQALNINISITGGSNGSGSNWITNQNTGQIIWGISHMQLVYANDAIIPVCNLTRLNIPFTEALVLNGSIISGTPSGYMAINAYYV